MLASASGIKIVEENAMSKILGGVIWWIGLAACVATIILSITRDADATSNFLMLMGIMMMLLGNKVEAWLKPHDLKPGE